MKHGNSLLACDPGLREVGFCHFLGTELVDFGVKSLRRPDREPTEILADAVTYLLIEKKPKIVAIGLGSGVRHLQNPMVKPAIESIKAVVGKYGSTVLEFAPRTINKIITGDERATNRMINDALCSRYPELSFYRDARRRSRARYFQNMFDAVAIGLTYLTLAGEQRHRNYATAN